MEKKKKKRQYGPFVYSYCPPPSLKNRLTNVTFHEEFIVLVSEISATNKNNFIFWDFNFHFDKQENSDTKQLLELLNSIGVSQRVCQPSHRQGHILDWVITWESPVDPIHSTSVEDLQLSDHFLVTVTTNMSKPRLQRQKVRCRNIKGTDTDAVCPYLSQHSLVQSPRSDVQELVTLYNETLLTLLEKHAPETKKFIPDHPDTAW